MSEDQRQELTSPEANLVQFCEWTHLVGSSEMMVGIIDGIQNLQPFERMQRTLDSVNHFLLIRIN